MVEAQQHTTADPIEQAHKNWSRQGWTEAAGPMAAATSVIRAQQILLNRANQVLKPFGITFARYELLALLSFSQQEKMLMSKASKRLQVHATSVTNAADRLEKDGLLSRIPVENDRRATVLELTDEGRAIVNQAAEALNEQFFIPLEFSKEESAQLFNILRRLRASAGDLG